MNKLNVALIGLGVAALAGCSQDEQFLAKQNGEYSAVVEKGVASRSYSDSHGAFKWEQGDDIAAYLTKGGESVGFGTLKMVGGAGTDVANYGSSVGGKPTDVAVFPVKAAKSYADGKLTVSYPNVYKNYNTDYNKDSMSVSDPMVAYFEKNEHKFLFRHVGGVIEWDVEVPAYIDEFTVKMNSGISGDFEVDATDKSNPYVSAKENVADAVSFKFELTSDTKEIHFYMPVPVGVYKGCTIYIKNNGTVVDSLLSEAENTVKRCDWIVMPPIYMGYTGTIEKTKVNSFDEFKAAAQNGGMIKVGEGTDFTSNVIVPQGKSLVANLNGKALKNTNDLWGESKNQWSLFSVQGGTLVLEGEGDVIAKENDCYPVDVQDGGHLVIKGGHYNGNIHAVYVYEGTAEIEGGVFEVQQKYPKAGKEDEFVLNCYDANRKAGTAKIIVTGGTFVNFNPADNYAEGAHTNFVAPGYVSVKTTYNGKEAWTVKKADAVATTNDDLLNAFKTTGNNIVVSSNVEVNKYTTLGKKATLTVEKGAELKSTKERSSAIKVTKGGQLDVYGNGKIIGASKNTSAPIGTCALTAEKGVLNIFGNVEVNGGEGSNVNNAVFVNSGTANIYSGYFYTGLDVKGKPNACIYVDSNDGKLHSVCNIYGGVFEAANPQYLLNRNDKTTSVCSINVYGGIFVGFNPADNDADGEHTNYVAPGYKSEKTTYNGKAAWKVVKE